MALKFKLPKIGFFSPAPGLVRSKTGDYRQDSSALIWTTVPNILNSATILPTLYLDKVFIDTLVKSIHTGTSNLRPAVQTIIFIVIGRFVIGTFKGIAGRIIGTYDDSLGRGLNAKLDELMGLKYSQIDLSVIEDPKFKDRYGKIEKGKRGQSLRLARHQLIFPVT